jgi:hypothetical protein
VLDYLGEIDWTEHKAARIGIRASNPGHLSVRCSMIACAG